MNTDESFGRLVREHRRSLDLTQEELARRAGCAPVTIRKIEHDALRPSQQIAERLAMALIIPLQERAAFVRLARQSLRGGRQQTAPTPTPPPAPEEIGAEDLSKRAIRGYVLGERIGSGGMGAVYRAVQPAVKREVAVKIILPQYANRPDFIRRFETEAQLVARLEHPHIVPLYDYWREPGAAYLVMRLLRGGSLQTVVQNGPIPLETFSRVIEQIGSALHTAHRWGVIHRNLRPANVLLDEGGNAYLADFGIAENLDNPILEDAALAEAITSSPAYLSPEQIRSEPVNPQTDIYCLGLLMYELLTGHRPFRGPAPIDFIQQHLSQRLPSLTINQSALPAALNDVIARATAKNPLERYQDVLELVEDIQRATLETTRRVVSTDTGQGVSSATGDVPTREDVPTERLYRLAAADNPYKGLRAFAEGDADDFFGRQTLVQQLLTRMGEDGDLSRFLAVVGPSGSGKSSVVKAGLVPALRRGGLPGSENWFIANLMPGAHPFEEIEAALLRLAVNPPESLLGQLREDERGLLRAVRRCLPNEPGAELVLVIDQFEEVFTLVQDESVRAHLLNSLVAAVLDERSRVRIVITLRADFTDRPLRYVDFGELLRRRAEFVLPLTPDELERAIAGPAERVGLILESGLTSTIIRDVGDQPGTLPLLQYALTELFERREGVTLTKAAYRAIGGVTGALARQAEEVFARLDEAGQSIARQLFLRLVAVGEGTEETRRRVLQSELESLTTTLSMKEHEENLSELRGSSISAILDAFGKSRLLTFDRHPVTRGPTVEVAHEALLREWSRLREWLQNSRASLRLQRQLASAATEWRSANGDSSFLLRGARLAQFENLASSSTVALTPEESAFLEASIAERERQTDIERKHKEQEIAMLRQIAEAEKNRAEAQTRAVGQLRRRAWALALVLIIAGALAVVAIVLGQRATQNAAEAQANFTQAEALRLAAEANSLLQAGSNADLIALLSIRSLKTLYSPQADAVLQQAAFLDYAERSILIKGVSISMALSPDGDYLLGGGDDNVVRLWDARTGRELRQLRGHTDNVISAAFSPDGKHILTGSVDNTARLWDVETGQELRRFIGHTKRIERVTFSADGKHILTASADATARLWDAQTGQALNVLSGHTAEVISLVASSDGKYILTGSADKTARLWDVQTGQPLHVLSGHTDAVTSVAFSPDSLHALTGSDDKTARLWDVQSGLEPARVFAGHTDALSSVAFSPDGQSVLTGSRDQTARLWDTLTGVERRRFTGHSAAVNSVAFSPDGAFVITGSADQTVRFWNARERSGRLFGGHTGAITGIVFSTDGQYVLTASTDKTAHLWETATGRALQTFIGHTDSVNDVALSPDGRYAATASADKTARLWETATGRELHILTGHTEAVNSVSFSPDSQYLLTAGSDNAVRLWEVQTGAELRLFTGKKLFSSSDTQPGLVDKAVFSPDGKFVLAGGNGIPTRMWDAQTGENVRNFDTNGVRDVAFSPDGRYALSSGLRTPKLWDTQTGKELISFSGHTDFVFDVAFSADSRLVLTGSKDGTARVWEAITGAPLRTFGGQPGGVDSVTFSPDGEHILIGGQDGAARLWEADYHDTIRYLCSRLLRDFTQAERAQYGLTDDQRTCPELRSFNNSSL
jgi:WD40 repeat protein/transcriptional regulator with XRE-family HTH domain